VIADEEEDGDAIGGKAINTSGKLPLLGLVWLTTLVSVTAEEDKVYPVFQGIVYNLVKGF